MKLFERIVFWSLGRIASSTIVSGGGGPDYSKASNSAYLAI